MGIDWDRYADINDEWYYDMLDRDNDEDDKTIWNKENLKNEET